MNKSAIQKFAIWARTEMIAQVKQRAYQYDITETGYGEENAVAVNGHALNDEERTQRKELVVQIKRKGYDQVMEEVAYTWFNRFIALRFMEVNNYLPSHIRVFSDGTGAFKPEILTDVLHLDLPGLDKEKVADLIDRNQREDLYRYLLLTQCNALYNALPGMFEQMGSYTELLLPNNILKPDGVLSRMVNDIPEEDWNISTLDKDGNPQGQVQIIGWLYQYYNTELNDQVYDGSMSKSRISKDLLPAATTIYTPDWSARYMVENSLGRLWIEGHPNDALKSGWKYYLDEAEQEPEVETQLTEIRKEYQNLRPQDIKVIDPCMGSGHILVYAFDVLVQIYKSTGVSERDAAALILQNNLYGLDIDDRAAQLAYFSVMMKARQYDRRIFSRGIQPHVYAIAESNSLDKPTIDYFVGDDPKLRTEFETLVDELRDAKEYGSILNISPLGFSSMYARVEEVRGDISLHRERVLNEVLPLIQSGEALAQKYDVVVTNPPYLGSSRFSPKLDEYVKRNYPDVKSDLSMVMYKHAVSSMKKRHGFVAFITTSSWMFLSSFEKLRNYLEEAASFSSLVDYGTELFDGKVGHNPIVSWVTREHIPGFQFVAIRLVDYCYARRDEKEPEFFENRNRYVATQDNFSKIPGSPVAYWVSEKFITLLTQKERIGAKYESGSGLSTADNDRFLRFFWEVDCEKIASGKNDNKKWYLFHKGGEYRKWYGNLYYVVNWENDGAEIKHWVTHNPKDPGTTSWSRRIFNTHLYFQCGITWSVISSGRVTFRAIDENAMISNAAGGIFGFDTPSQRNSLMAALNTKIWAEIFSTINPTLNYSSGVIQKAPTPLLPDTNLGDECVEISKADWDSFETSWDFKEHPFITSARWSARNGEAITIRQAYNDWEGVTEGRFRQLKENEEELNRIFIEIYGLQDELTPEVEDKDVTVRKADWQRDVRSFISYAVGCMFGRYSLDEPGLAYAGGEWDASKYRVFQPDRDNVIPICDDEYFEDDIVGRFVAFVEKAFGEEVLEENLRQIADALGGKGTPREVIRNYFLNDFYADHLKIYQKRPIYWLFDSGKKNGFKALIYMHRYQSDLLARIRTDYVHEQQERYRTQLLHIGDALENASPSERVRLTKLQKKLQEQSVEIQKYEEKIHHLADTNIEIDLDDGVKHNYALFADVLARIK